MRAAGQLKRQSIWANCKYSKVKRVKRESQSKNREIEMENENTIYIYMGIYTLYIVKVLIYKSDGTLSWLKLCGNITYTT